jgi:hypothetical protein
MKYVDGRPYADPEAAMQNLLDYANAFEPIQDGRIYIEKLMGHSCSRPRAHRRNTQPA